MRWAQNLEEIAASIEQPEPPSQDRLEAAGKMLSEAGYHVIPKDRIKALDAFHEISLLDLGRIDGQERLMEAVHAGLAHQITEQAIKENAVTTKIEDQFLKRCIGARLTVILPEPT